MNNTEDKFLIVQKETFFDKIKNAFANFFKKEEKEVDIELDNNEKDSKTFDSFIKVDIGRSKEFEKLEKDFSSGKKLEKDLTEEEKQELNEFYDEKIASLQASIKAKEEKLNQLKSAV